MPPVPAGWCQHLNVTRCQRTNAFNCCFCNDPRTVAPPFSHGLSHQISEEESLALDAAYCLSCQDYWRGQRSAPLPYLSPAALRVALRSLPAQQQRNPARPNAARTGSGRTPGANPSRIQRLNQYHRFAQRREHVPQDLNSGLSNPAFDNSDVTGPRAPYQSPYLQQTHSVDAASADMASRPVHPSQQDPTSETRIPENQDFQLSYAHAATETRSRLQGMIDQALDPAYRMSTTASQLSIDNANRMGPPNNPTNMSFGGHRNPAAAPDTQGTAQNTPFQHQTRPHFQNAWNNLSRDEYDRRSFFHSIEAEITTELSPNSASPTHGPNTWQQTGAATSNPFSHATPLPFGYAVRENGQHSSNRATTNATEPNSRTGNQPEPVFGHASTNPRQSNRRSSQSMNTDNDLFPSALSSNVQFTERVLGHLRREERRGGNDERFAELYNRHLEHLEHLEHAQMLVAAERARQMGFAGNTAVQKGLDDQNDGRPAPKESEELTVNLECKVCMSQLVDTVLLPCGHAVLCRWCAEQHMAKSRVGGPRIPASCPMCRKPIKQKARMYIS